MRVLIANSEGPGAVIGTRLEKADIDVTFLDHPRRTGALLFKQLKVLGKASSFTGYTHHIEPAEIFSPRDLIIIATDAGQVPDLIEILPRAVAPSTVILSLVLGLDHVEMLRTTFSTLPVLDGLHDVVARMEADGSILQLAGSADSIRIAGNDSDRDHVAVEEVTRLLGKGGIAVQVDPDLEQKRWDRIVRMTALGGIAAITQASLSRISAFDGELEQVWLGIQEAAAVAEVSGHRLDVAGLLELVEGLPRIESVGTRAMLDRVAAGETGEIATLIGQIRYRARRFKLATPTLDLIGLALNARGPALVSNLHSGGAPASTPRAPMPNRSGWFSRRWVGRSGGNRS